MYGVKQLSVMVGGDFFKNETKVPHGQAGFHSCGGLAHEGLRRWGVLWKTQGTEIQGSNQIGDLSSHKKYAVECESGKLKVPF